MISGFVDVCMSINEVFGSKKKLNPYIEEKGDGEMLIVWDRDGFYLEVGIIECGPRDCSCFRWFFIPDGFVKGQAGTECASDISKDFKQILLDNLVCK